MSNQTFNAEVVDAIFRERDQLKAENARLRELVADMFAFLDGADCARFPAGDVVITQAQISNFYDRMSDLGVEVDDG